MKNKKLHEILLLTIILGVHCGCWNSSRKDVVKNPATASLSGETRGPVVKFDTTVFDFGRITEGEIVTHEFTIRNEGDASLLIASVNPDCGCTVADFPKFPIEPGGQGKIKVSFDSEGKRGQVYRQVRVITNANPSTHVLVVRGEVVSPMNQTKK